MDEREIYEMDLFDELQLYVDYTGVEKRIKRVPGGWIYIHIINLYDNSSITSCFIPYNDEFKTGVKSNIE